MQGLPSTSMRMFQKKQQRQWQQWQQQLKQQQQQQRSGVKSENDDENVEGNRPTKKNSKSGDKSGGLWTDEVGKNKSATSIASTVSDNKDQKLNGECGSSGMVDDSEDGYKSIMEDQYYPLVILIEATKENKSSGKLQHSLLWQYVEYLSVSLKYHNRCNSKSSNSCRGLAWTLFGRESSDLDICMLQYQLGGRIRDQGHEAEGLD